MKQDKYSRSKSTKAVVTEAEIVTYITIPPDGGWGWFIVFISFFINFVADGSMMTYGLFKVEIMNDLNATQAQVLLPSSIMTGLYYTAGTVACAMTNKFGFKITGVSGGIFAFGGYLASSFVNSLPLLILTYGCFIGIGFSLSYIGSILAVGYYFERWRALATSIAVCGSSMGTTLFPLIFSGVLNNLTWRRKYQVLTGLCAISGILCFFLRPLKQVRVVSGQQQVSSKPLTIITSLESVFTEEEESFFPQFHNVTYPTHAEIHSKNPTIEDEVASGAGSARSKTISVRSARSLRSTRSLRGKPAKQPPNALYDRLSVIVEDNDNYNCCHKCLLKVNTKLCCCCVKEEIPTRPMYRDDIFYHASLVTIPSYKESKKMKDKIDYQMKVTRVTTQDDVEESYIPCVICPESVKRVVATMLDFSLIKHAPYMFLNISGFFTTLGYYIPFQFITQSAIAHNVPIAEAKFILTAVGIANTFGRILSGILTSIPNIKATPISIIGIFVSSGAIGALPWYYSTIFQYSMGIIFGIFISVVATLRPIIIVELVGLERLTNAFGIYMLIQGISSLTGITLGGIILENTKSFKYVYLFAAVNLFIGGIAMFPLKRLARWQAKKDASR